MGDDDTGPLGASPVRFSKVLSKCRRRTCIQPGGGLIEYRKAWPTGQSKIDPNPLALAGRAMLEGLLLQLVNAECFAKIDFYMVIKAGMQSEYFADKHARFKAGGLKVYTQLFPNQSIQVPAPEFRITRFGLSQSEDSFEETCLTRAIRADNSDDRTLLDRKLRYVQDEPVGPKERKAIYHQRACGFR